MDRIAPPLSLTGRRWCLRAREESDRDLVHTLALERNINIDQEDDAITEDPPFFPDTPKALTHLRAAIARGERIGIIGDYDCDGITATALLVRLLRRRGMKPVVRLPHRVRDGYGLKSRHIDDLASENVRLLLTVDTGITANAAVTHAAERGMDTIIIDHHEWSNEPTAAHAILHPSLIADTSSPWPCAAGIAFALVSAFEGASSWEGRDEDLALAMIGTIADLVPLRGYNRVLARQGLRAIERLQSGPLADLAARVRTPGQPLSSMDIAFRIAPRINAAGRMADPLLGLHALLEGGAAIRELEVLNALRQRETHACVEHALAQLGDPLESLLCAADPSYGPGIIGLIAGKLTDRFGRPSMAVSVRDEECTASLRSTDAYNIIDGLRRSSDLLTSYGGHRQAAGCTFPSRALKSIQEALLNDVATQTSPEDLVLRLPVDATIPLSSVSRSLVGRLRRLEPFGQGNPEPLFLIEDIHLMALRAVGRDGQHLQGIAGGHKIIGFGLGALLAHAQKPLDLVCRLGIDTWNGREQVQLVVVDMRIAEKTPVALHEGLLAIDL